MSGPDRARQRSKRNMKAYTNSPAMRPVNLAISRRDISHHSVPSRSSSEAYLSGRNVTQQICMTSAKPPVMQNALASRPAVCCFHASSTAGSLKRGCTKRIRRSARPPLSACSKDAALARVAPRRRGDWIEFLRGAMTGARSNKWKSIQCAQPKIASIDAMRTRERLEMSMLHYSMYTYKLPYKRRDALDYR